MISEPSGGAGCHPQHVMFYISGWEQLIRYTDTAAGARTQ